jgi:hypothetical protein
MAYQQGSAEGESIVAIVGEFVRLIMRHWDLARAELADSGAGLGLAALYTLAALLVGILALTILLAGVALALATVLPLWAAFLLVGAATASGAIGLLLLARRQSRRCALLPHRAIASLQQNLSELAGELS